MSNCIRCCSLQNNYTFSYLVTLKFIKQHNNGICTFTLKNACKCPCAGKQSLISRVKVPVITILPSVQPFSLYFPFLLLLNVSPGDRFSMTLAYLLFSEPIITLETKLTMALAGCSGSCSANRWHTLSVEVPVFLATKPKILQR